MFWFIVIIVVIFWLAKQQINKTESLKKVYDVRLQGTDKAAALAAGRAYYSALRNGKLTIYDEQAIANDISTMKQS